MINKKDYIINQLRKTKNKQYENYCITRIIHKLDRLDIQFITQQLFKRDNGKIALADLYLPQINTYVEIDETHHLKQQEEDKERTKEIEKNNFEIKRKLANLEEVILEPIEELRISANCYDSLEDINKNTDLVIEKIKNKIKEKGDKFVPWTNIYLEPSVYINKGSLSTLDNAKFRTIQEVSELFNKGYKGTQQAYFIVDVKNKIYVWCPTLKLDNDDCKNIPYDNELSKDGKYIFESSKENNEKFLNSIINSSEKRYAFAKYKDETGNKSYKFIGVYVLDKQISKGLKKRAWKKIDDKINIRQFFNK